MNSQVTAQENCLYVGQREMAVLTPEDGMELVGSEDATTCHILVLRESTSSTVGLAHLDSEDPAQLLALEREVRLKWYCLSYIDKYIFIYLYLQ